MKNNEILLDAIGEVREDLIPELSEKKKDHKVLSALFVSAGVCAAVIACSIFLPRRRHDGFRGYDGQQHFGA